MPVPPRNSGCTWASGQRPVSESAGGDFPGGAGVEVGTSKPSALARAPGKGRRPWHPGGCRSSLTPCPRGSREGPKHGEKVGWGANWVCLKDWERGQGSRCCPPEPGHSPAGAPQNSRLRSSSRTCCAALCGPPTLPHPRTPTSTAPESDRFLFFFFIKNKTKVTDTGWSPQTGSRWAPSRESVVAFFKVLLHPEVNKKKKIDKTKP